MRVVEENVDERLLTGPPPGRADPPAYSPVAAPAESAGQPAGEGKPRTDNAPALLSSRTWSASSRALVLIETERLRGGGFVLAPVFLAAGAFTYSAAAAEPEWFAILLSALAAMLGLVLLRERTFVRALAAVALLVALGFAAGKAEAWRRSTPMLGSAVATEITGRIVALERQHSGRVRVIVDVLTTQRPALRFAPSRIRVTAARLDAAFRPGVGIAGRVRLLPPSGPVRPGGYDFSWRAFFDGVGANGFFLGSPRAVPVAPPGRLAGLANRLEALRIAMADRIRDRIGGAEGEIAAALIVGAAAGIPNDLADAMRLSGLFHVLSISGLHMALVAGLVMGGLRLVFAFFPTFAERHAVKKVAAAAALAAATFYLFLSGAGVATQRSYLMVAVMLAAVIADRPALTMRNLAIAALAILVWSPHEIAGPSFQMSFAATAALIAGWRGFSAWRLRQQTPVRSTGLAATALRWTAAALAGVAATSLLAGGATTLFSAWHFHRVAPLGLFANLAAMPVVSGVIMPAGVAAALAMPFGLDGPFLDAMGRGIAAMNAIANETAARSPLDTVGLVPGHAVALFSAGLVVAAAATTRLAALAAPLLAAGAALAFGASPPGAFVSEDGRLVAVLDGDALAVNRSRPNAFSLDEWRRAVNVEKIVRPGAGGFTCENGLCVFGKPGGPLVVHVETGDAETWCGRAALIVFADPVAKTRCRPGEATVILRRTLARRGSAAIDFIQKDGRSRVVVEHAIAEPFRPWHAHRAFSRAARGLPERKP